MSDELEELHRAANRLYDADSLDHCYDIAIEAAVSILGMDWCSLIAPADDADVFEVKAISEEGTVEVGHRPFGLDEGVAGHVYQTKTTHHLDDVDDSERARPTDRTIRSALTVPVGDWGIFHAMSTEPETFDERDRNWAELLCMSLGTAIERQRREAELRSKNERLEEFAAVVSHDLRNPLQVASGHLELAAESCESTHLDEAMDALRRSDALIDDLLALACAGESEVELETVRLAELVAEVWGTVDAVAATIRVDVDCSIEADRSRLRQLLENLLANAVDHGGPDVTVTVGSLPDGFYVEDSGPGIPEERRDEVFEMGHTTARDGSGFGLRIVERVAEGHGWDVRVTDGADGGARFEITGVSFPE